MFHENYTSCSSCVPIKIRDFPNVIGESKIRLIKSSINDTLNCTNINVEGRFDMFEGDNITFKVTLNETVYGCQLNLNFIPLSDHLSSKEMDQLLFFKSETKLEIYSRFSLLIYVASDTFTFGKTVNSSSISTAGHTEVYSPTYY